MRIEVVYALPERQLMLVVELPDGANVADAVSKSRIRTEFPEISIGETPVGVFGERVDWSRVLEDGDRVELYRGLIADPREQRRKRAEKQGAA
ncbi:MAG: RnfH family protein [Chromatiales bacterium]|nr:RnfH family protein [Chromatiales bacterium]